MIRKLAQQLRPPTRYKNSGGPAGWDLSIAGLLIPVSVTMIEELTHDVLGFDIPHSMSTFGGTLLGCMLAVWFARRYQPHYVKDKENPK